MQPNPAPFGYKDQTNREDTATPIGINVGAGDVVGSNANGAVATLDGGPATGPSGTPGMVCLRVSDPTTAVAATDKQAHANILCATIAGVTITGNLTVTGAITGSVTSGPYVENTTSGTGNTVSIAAAAINDGNDAFDILNHSQTTITGDMTLSIASDPGGATAYKVGMRIILSLVIGGTARSLLIASVGGLGQGVITQFDAPLITGPASPAVWLITIEYIGNNNWKLVGQASGQSVI